MNPIYEKLYPYQKQVVDKLKNVKKIGIFLDMGLGKTLTSLAWLLEQSNVKTTFIIATNKKDTVKQWAKVIKEELPNRSVKYPTKETFKEFLNQKFEDDDIVIITHAGVRSVELRKHINVKSIMIYDESHKCKNRKSKNYKNIEQISKIVDRLVFLTGTPVDSDMVEYFYIMKILVDSNLSYNAFLNEYFTYELQRLYFDSKTKHYSNIVLKVPKEVILDKFKHCAVYSKSEHVFPLPEKIETKEYVEYYNEISKQIGSDRVYRDLRIRHKLTLRHIFKELASGYIRNCIETGINSFNDEYFTTNYKKDYVKHLIAKLQIETSPIVFYNYNGELKILKEIAKELDIKIYEKNGHKNELDLYLRNNSFCFLAINYGSGSESTDGLQHKTNHLIMFSPTDSAQNFKQSIGRLYRIGQKKTVYIHKICAKKSIEEAIYDSIENGRDFTDEVFEQCNFFKRYIIEEKEGNTIDMNKDILITMEQNNNTTETNDTYKNHPEYNDIKKVKKDDIYAAFSTRIPNLKASDNKEEMIKKIIEYTMFEESVQQNQVSVPTPVEQPVQEPITVAPPVAPIEEIKPPIDEEHTRNTITNFDGQPEPTNWFSHSKVDCFLKNPKDYYFRYVERVVPKDSKNYFFYGTIFHLMYEFKDENYVRSIVKDMEYTDPDRDDIINCAIELGRQAVLNFTQFKNVDNELEFRYKLSENCGFTGKIDFLYQKEDGTYGIGELKTASTFANWEKNKYIASQPNRYAKVLELLTVELGSPIVISEYRICVALKPRNNKLELINGSLFREFVIPINRELMEDIWNGTLQIIEWASTATYFPINETGSSFYGEWDYAKLYDPTVEDPTQYFKVK